MNAQTESKHIEDQLKLFSERIKHLNINNWDPSLVQLFSNYQRTLVNYRKFDFFHKIQKNNLTFNFQLRIIHPITTFHRIHFICHNRKFRFNAMLRL